MKKLSTIIMALALVLGMSQCKKQETPTSATPSNPGVHITVNVGDQDGKDGKDNNGEKHNIAPAYGLFAFTQGDVLYVGHHGKYVGKLTFNGACFDGTIYPDATATDNLHFYFLGNAALSEPLPETIEEGTDITSRTINIADQSGNLPVLSYGASTKPFTGTGTTYSTTLRNQCALVRINLLNKTTDAVMLSSVPTEATINFASNTITPTNTRGDITLYGEESVDTHRWAILLPGTDLSGRQDLIWQGEGGEEGMPAIGNNTYVNAGIGEGIQIKNQIAVALPDADLVIKNGNGFSEFSVSPTKKVYFSKANLTWNATDGYHFHDTQFEEEHSGGSSISNFDLSNLPAHGDVQQTGLTGLDRFTWGHITNQSINTSYYLTNNDIADGQDPEWGKQMTGEGNDQWRTLTADEWNYLLHERSGNRFMTVSVLIPCTYKGNPAYTNISGLLLFPDNFDYTGLGLTPAANANSVGFWSDMINKVYATSSSYTPASGNYIVYDDIVTNYAHMPNKGIYKLIEPSQDLEHLYTNSSSNMYKLLQAGCVFLPAVGCREGATYKKYYYYGDRNNPPQGFYWTSDRVTVGTQEKANYFWFGHVGGNAVETDPRPTFDADNTQDRDLGCCVRLVWDAN